MTTTLQLPFAHQRGPSPVLDPAAHGTASGMALQSSLVKKGAHLPHIILHQSARSGRDSISPKWSHSIPGSVPSSRSPSPRRHPMVRRSSGNSSYEEDVAMVMQCSSSLTSSSRTLSVPSPPLSSRVSPCPLSTSPSVIASPISSPITTAALTSSLLGSAGRPPRFETQMSVERPRLETQMSVERPRLETQMSLERPRLETQMSLERRTQMTTENEAVGDAGVRHGRGSPDLCQALGSLSIGKRKEVTNQVERKQQGFPSKRAKTVAEYAKTAQISPLFLSHNPDVEALLTCVGFAGGAQMPFSAPPFARQSMVGGNAGATHTMEMLVGLPESVLGKRNSAPPRMMSEVQRRQREQQQQKRDEEDASVQTSQSSDIFRAPVDTSDAQAEANMLSASLDPQALHRTLCRTDSQQLLETTQQQVEVQPLPPPPPPLLQLPSPSPAPPSAAVSPSRYVSNRLRLQRRRSLQTQQARLKKTIPEGSQENLSVVPGRLRSPSPMVLREASFDNGILDKIRNSLEDRGAFFFSATSSGSASSLSSARHSATLSLPHQANAMAMLKGWRSVDSDMGMNMTDNGDWSGSSSPRVSMVTDHQSLARQTSCSSGSSFGSGMSRSSSQEFHFVSLPQSESIPMDLDSATQSLPSDPSQILGSNQSAGGALSFGTTHATTGESGGSPVRSSKRTKLLGALPKVPSLALNGSDNAVDVDSMCSVEDNGVPRAPSPVIALDECSVRDAARWAGLTGSDPFSYDMACMLEGYSWDRVVDWTRYAARTGQQVPQAGVSNTSLNASPVMMRSQAVRTQSLASPSPTPLDSDHASVVRSRSLRSPVGERDGTGGDTAMNVRDRRAAFSRSGTKSTSRRSSLPVSISTESLTSSPKPGA